MWQDITQDQREQFNALATHPLQSYEWGEFRKKSGVTVLRKGLFAGKKLTQAFQLTIHPIAHTNFTVGYLPKGSLPTQSMFDELKRIGNTYHCIFIQLEPNIQVSSEALKSVKQLSLLPAAHPLFTKHTLYIDLTKANDDLLKAMHPKARYNIKVATKHNVSVTEENTKESFALFWHLTQETTSRQQFFAHTKRYHQTQWETLAHTAHPNTLSSHLLVARYLGKPLTAWILFLFHDTLYYPYGASLQEHRETMHSTLMMWEAMQFGKKHHATLFDLWGAAAPNTPSSDPWFGFTQFKERFGPERVEFVGSFDLVLNKPLYQAYKLADKLRWLLLKFKK